MATINVRSYADGKKVYRVRIRRHGVLVSRQFPTKGEAEAFARSTEHDLEGRAPAQATTLAALIDRYRPSAPTSYGGECLDYWSAKIGHLRLGEITPAIARAHRDELARTPAKSHNYKTSRTRSPTTVRKYLVVLGAVFQFAIRELSWTVDNPVKMVKKPKAGAHRVRFLTESERASLLAAARASTSSTLCAAILLSLSTGMRKGELHKLLWRDVDLTAGLALLRETKNGDTRGVPLTPPSGDVADCGRSMMLSTPGQPSEKPENSPPRTVTGCLRAVIDRIHRSGRIPSVITTADLTGSPYNYSLFSRREPSMSGCHP